MNFPRLVPRMAVMLLGRDMMSPTSSFCSKGPMRYIKIGFPADDPGTPLPSLFLREGRFEIGACLAIVFRYGNPCRCWSPVPNYPCLEWVGDDLQIGVGRVRSQSHQFVNKPLVQMERSCSIWSSSGEILGKVSPFSCYFIFLKVQQAALF